MQILFFELEIKNCLRILDLLKVFYEVTNLIFKLNLKVENGERNDKSTRSFNFEAWKIIDVEGLGVLNTPRFLFLRDLHKSLDGNQCCKFFPANVMVPINPGQKHPGDKLYLKVFFGGMHLMIWEW